MGDTATKSKSTIKLKGSAQLVSEFFFYGVNNILYQRGIYPQDNFEQKSQYGLKLFSIKNEQVKQYLAEVLSQIKDWTLEGLVEKLVVIISNADTTETLERWEFEVCPEQGFAKTDAGREKKVAEKDLKVIQREMRDVMRQITGCVTFLPCIDCSCSFNLLVYTKKECEASDKWADTSACLIPHAETVKLKSFSTSVHKVDARVTYKVE